MSDNFYDNSDMRPNEKGHVSIDRVYCLEFKNFDDSMWNKLAEVYSILPNKVDTKFPFWFGIEGENDFYLYVSVEPSGLQVCGYLMECDWFKWEEMFGKYLNVFPLFET